jgi:hypothetical protein
MKDAILLGIAVQFAAVLLAGVFLMCVNRKKT